MKLIDLTHAFTDDMPVYPGDTKPIIRRTHEVSTDGYNDHDITTGMHVGTHMDAPLHFVDGGKTMDQISPEKFFGEGVLIDARGKTEIDSDLLKDITLTENSIVLILTGFDKKFRAEIYYKNYPVLTLAFAEKIIKAKVKAVGTDTPTPDKPPFPIHKMLLPNEILIIENLTNLEQLLGVNNFEIIALPVKLSTEAAPVRVMARIL